jgi:hypothetical protein
MTSIDDMDTSPASSSSSGKPFELDLEEIKKFSVEKTTPAAYVSANKGEILIKKVAEALGTSDQTAFVLICIICQKGGTAKKAQGNIYAVVNGKRLDLETLRKLMKTIGFDSTLRQWARTYCKQIFSICKIYDIPGDLAKKLGRSSDDLQADDLIYLSNFQMDNEDCPRRVKELLMKHYNEMFQKKV